MRAVTSGGGLEVPAEHQAVVGQAMFHYAQSAVWLDHAEQLRSEGRHEASASAEQNALGHALALDHVRNQLPSALVNHVQSHMNAARSQPDFLERIPQSWRTPVRAGETPINGGGLDGTTKWTPPVDNSPGIVPGKVL